MQNNKAMPPKEILSPHILCRAVAPPEKQKREQRKTQKPRWAKLNFDKKEKLQ